MVLTEIDMWNMALSLIGIENLPPHNNIDSLKSQTAKKNARLCNQFFELTKSAILYRYRWRSGIGRKSLNLTSEPSGTSIYSKVYLVPEDSLRVIQLNDNETPYSEEGRYILTNADSPTCSYIIRVTQYGILDPLCIQAIIHDLAVNIVIGLKGEKSLDLKNELKDTLKGIISTSKAINAIKERPPRGMEQRDAGDWVKSHRRIGNRIVEPPTS